MANELARRAFLSEVKRHRQNAEGALARLQTTFQNLDLDQMVISQGTVRNAANTLVELSTALAALKALDDIDFLAELDTPKEKADG